MQTYWLNTSNATAEVELRSAPVPEPGPRQLLVRMRAAALNRGEFILGHGLTKAGGGKALGIEGAGEVVAAGAEAKRFAPGERVMGRFAGAMAEYALLNEAEALPVPARLSWQQAAAIPVTFMVAHDMLVTQGHLPAGGWLLVTGVSSGVGVASFQIARALGARVIGTSGTEAKLERLRLLGLDVPLYTRSANFFDAVMQATAGAGVDVAVNTVGGTVFAECLRSLAFQGRLATVGYLDGVLDAKVDLQALHARRLVLFGVSNKMVGDAQRAEMTAHFADDVLPAIADGRIQPLLDRAFDFGQVAAAKTYMESNSHLGKIVVNI
ncbi:MAG: Alcohol dehydrogenase, zinc-binding protein [Burkholderia sp.]|nr:Alcohol dehydrogenase, zinc-binding protein [Burkholderia sp.]